MIFNYCRNNLALLSDVDLVFNAFYEKVFSHIKVGC